MDTKYTRLDGKIFYIKRIAPEYYGVYVDGDDIAQYAGSYNSCFRYCEWVP